MPFELNVEPLTKLHGPLTWLYVRAELSVFVVDALTVQSAPGWIGDGAVPKVTTGVALISVTPNPAEVAAV